MIQISKDDLSKVLFTLNLVRNRMLKNPTGTGVLLQEERNKIAEYAAECIQNLENSIFQ
jgi:hypothetical protein